jgi:nitronate monooxygenase
MSPRTAFTDLAGLNHPIIQGPFGGGLSTTRLVVAVSNGGGLGSFGAHGLAPTDIHALVAELRRVTARPFAINLWVPLPGETEHSLTAGEFAAHAARLRPFFEELGQPLPALAARYADVDFAEQLDALIEARPPVASFVFGAPPPAAMAEMKRRGIITIGAATTVAEARHLEGAGFDALVASGSDAGGHRPAFLRPALDSLVGTFALVPQVVDAVRIPVIAAGGIADARGVAAALTLGAAAAQVGTAFLACDESGASSAHKDALAKVRAEDTRLTRAFSGRHARGIVNRIMRELDGIEPNLPPYPIHSWFMHPLRRAAAATGRADLQSLWAGQAAALTRRRSAADLLAALATGLDDRAADCPLPQAHDASLGDSV